MSARILTEAEREDLARIIVSGLDAADDPDALAPYIAARLSADNPEFDAEGSDVAA